MLKRMIVCEKKVSVYFSNECTASIGAGHDAFTKNGKLTSNWWALSKEVEVRLVIDEE